VKNLFDAGKWYHNQNMKHLYEDTVTRFDGSNVQAREGLQECCESLDPRENVTQLTALTRRLEEEVSIKDSKIDQMERIVEAARQAQFHNDLELRELRRENIRLRKELNIPSDNVPGLPDLPRGFYLRKIAKRYRFLPPVTFALRVRRRLLREYQSIISA